jgi:microcystin-dependent protein
MAYTVRFTDEVTNSPLQVEDNTINESTSLSFPGRNVTGYGKIIAENFLHLLENFAAKSPPPNPVAGQLYFNSNENVNQLELFDGTNWVAAGGLKKGTSFPSNDISVAGDLFSNISTGELYFYTGSGWILIGPETPSASRTGVLREVLNDGAGSDQNVVSFYVNGVRLGVISETNFVPNPAISGFVELRKGVNLNSQYENLWGTSSSSLALTVGDSVVPAENFLRSDVTSISNNDLIIRSMRGVTIGPEAQLRLTSDGNVAVITQNTPNSSLDLRVNNNGSVRTVIRVDSSERVGINNFSPQESLDVNGNILSSGQIRSSNTDESASVATGSGVFAGGVGIAKSLIVGENQEISGILKTNSILPLIPNGSPATASGTIGSESLKYQRIFSERFDGEFYGKLVGTFEGTVINGSAPRLTSRTKFKIRGDIVDEDGFQFDGSFQATGEDPLEKTFTTTLNSNFITTKLRANSITNTDEFLFSRGTPPALRKISRQDLFASIPRTPVGSIVAYAGAQPPTGWLLCDGSEVRQTDFTALFSVIQYTYGDIVTLQGRDSFKLPDLRGRFPLGLDNMNGNNRVLSRIANPDGSFSLITTISGPAGRVSNTQARLLGGSGGLEAIFIARSELPEHKHDLRGTLSNGAKGSKFYAYLPESTVDGIPEIDAVAGQAPPGVDTFGKFLTNSGGILTDSGAPHVQTAANVMNPYISLNYIIYAGTDQ